MNCIKCDEESPYTTMRIPFLCKCGWAILDKSLFMDNEYPASIKKFYEDCGIELKI